jgi:hypothetical protein
MIPFHEDRTRSKHLDRILRIMTPLHKLLVAGFFLLGESFWLDRDFFSLLDPWLILIDHLLCFLVS